MGGWEVDRGKREKLEREECDLWAEGAGGGRGGRVETGWRRVKVLGRGYGEGAES